MKGCYGYRSTGEAQETTNTGKSPRGLTGGFIVINVNSFQLQIGVSMIRAGGVDAVLIGDHLPKFSSDLIKKKKGKERNDASAESNDKETLTKIRA